MMDAVEGLFEIYIFDEYLLCFVEWKSAHCMTCFCFCRSRLVLLEVWCQYPSSVCWDVPHWRASLLLFLSNCCSCLNFLFWQFDYYPFCPVCGTTSLDQIVLNSLVIHEIMLGLKIFSSSAGMSSIPGTLLLLFLRYFRSSATSFTVIFPKSASNRGSVGACLVARSAGCCLIHDWLEVFNPAYLLCLCWL